MAERIYSICTTVTASPEASFCSIRRIGGDAGWYYANQFWQLRGLVDEWIGGPGMRRGRRDPDQLRAGDILDCWRVEALERDHRLLLAAEMKVPGRAWLEFLVEGDHTTSTIRLTARYDPHGLWGLIYWYLTYPVHRILFNGLLERLAERSRLSDSSCNPAPPG